MTTTEEGKVKAKAVLLYKAAGAKYDRAAATGMGRNGRADDVVRRAGDGHFMGVEFKKLDVFEVTALQRVWLEDCSAGGGTSPAPRRAGCPTRRRGRERCKSISAS